ncbi:hypothetical protein [Corynebacterium mayonis]|uniref:Rv2732c family membrane protein n=1 Tax=Corynebacterium mayonis TaxID=3062461 RepID=UPI0031403681
MTNSTGNAEELARQEREAAKKVEFGSSRWVLLVCVVVYLAALFMPFAGGVNGWQVVARRGVDAADIKLTEQVFVWLSFAGLLIMTSLVLATKRFLLAVPAWMLTTVSFLLSALAIWLRRTSTAYDAGLYHGPGIYLMIFAVGVAVFAYVPVVVGRSAAQAEIAQRRASSDELDDISKAQQAAAVSRGEGNPLLVDDRRARAAERHRSRLED